MAVPIQVQDVINVHGVGGIMIKTSRAAALALLCAVIYLAIVNFSIPFTTLDEINTVINSGTVWPSILDRGRMSGFIAYSVNQFTAFSTPDTLSLLPRFFTMLALLVALIGTLNLVGISLTYSICTASLLLMSHQLDWQHNGLIAFFGNYNLLLAFFLFAILIDLIDEKRFWIRFLAFAAAILSFASELFVILSAVYVLTRAVDWQERNRLYKSIIFLPTVIYLFAFVLTRFFVDNPTGALSLDRGLQNYLLGSVEQYPIWQIVLGALQYVGNSIPFLSSFISVTGLKSEIVGIIVLTFALYCCGRSFSNIWSRRLSSSNGKLICADHKRFSLTIVLAALVVIPQVLMALQPMKLEWILSGASSRYAFSLYSWIGIGCLYVMRISDESAGFALASRNRGRHLIVWFLLALFVAVAVYRNISFAFTYAESRERWVAVSHIARNEVGSTIRIPSDLLQHPYIVPVDANLMKAFVKRAFNKDAQICTGYDFDFSGSAAPLGMIGFHGAEFDGRWTSGRESIIAIPFPIPAGVELIVYFADAFGKNSETLTKVSFQNQDFAIQITPGAKLSIRVESPLSSGEFRIMTKEVRTPLSLGIGEDPRPLGVKIARIELRASDVAIQDALSRGLCV